LKPEVKSVSTSAQHVYLDQARCRGCQLCLGICPNELFKPGLEPNADAFFPVEMQHPEYCINCMRCVQICPDSALDVPEQPTLNIEGYVFGFSLKLHRLLNQDDR